MAGFVVRRVLHMIPLLVGITFLTFLIIDFAPGDSFAQLKMNPLISPDVIAALEREFGYGEPLAVRYGKWLWRVLHGDFGLSLAYRVNVGALIGMRAFNTIILATTSIAFSWLLAIPIGLFVAMHPRSFADRLLSFLAFLGMSVPNFFLAFLLMFAALRSGWFPIGGSTSIGYEALSAAGKVADRLHHLALPVIVLGTAGVARLMRFVRAHAREIKQGDVGRTARAKGLPERVVVGKH